MSRNQVLSNRDNGREWQASAKGADAKEEESSTTGALPSTL